MGTASRVVIGIVVGTILATVSLGIGMESSSSEVEMLFCGDTPDYGSYMRCRNAVENAGSYLCCLGAPVWGAVAFALTFFFLPKERKGSSSPG